MTDIKKLLGNRIRELRKKQGLTQEKLAEKIGIEARNLLNIENAKTLPRAATINKLIEVFELTPNDFFSFEQEEKINEIRSKVFKAVKKDDNLVRLVYKLIK